MDIIKFVLFWVIIVPTGIALAIFVLRFVPGLVKALVTGKLFGMIRAAFKMRKEMREVYRDE